MSEMKTDPQSYLVVGLGNPGPRYATTRHNVGFMVIDRLCAEIGATLRKPAFARYLFGRGTICGAAVTLATPLTFMNRSGEVIGRLLDRAKATTERLVVVCDNLDLPPGTCRLKRSGGSAGHRGLESIISHLGTSDFYRLYVGIGRPENGEVIAHVLGDPPEEQTALFAESVARAASGIHVLLTRSPTEAMNEINQRRSPTREKG